MAKSRSQERKGLSGVVLFSFFFNNIYCVALFLQKSSPIPSAYFLESILCCPRRSLDSTQSPILAPHISLTMKSRALAPVALLASSATASPSLAARAASSSSTTTTSTASSSTPSTLAWKAGLSGYPTIETESVFLDNFVPYISWYSNYNPVAPNIAYSAPSGTSNQSHTVLGAPMLWGMGNQCLNGPDGPVDEYRLGNFTAEVTSGDTDPSVMFGFYEPDCDCNSSSHIVDVSTGLSKWNEYIAPLASRGIKLGSPPMCTQLDQTWLSDFVELNNGTVNWDITSIHVNKPTAAEGAQVVEYYYQKFGKPIWVSELTCVDDSNWTSCGNQTVVNNFIDEMVDYLESTDYVIAYGANTGEGEFFFRFCLFFPPLFLFLFLSFSSPFSRFLFFVFLSNNIRRLMTYTGVPGVWNLFTTTYPFQLTETGEHYKSVLQQLLTNTEAGEDCDETQDL